MEITKPTILLIDDDAAIRKVLGRRLEGQGFHVVGAEDGEEGLRTAEAVLPDLILLDVMMPKMKGREVCAILKANPRTKEIPVIFLSALGLADHISAGMRLGADDYVVKPFHPDKLNERIRICLARHQKAERTV